MAEPTQLAVRGDGFVLRLATPADNEALCDLFASVHLKASLDLAQERAPDFFALPRMHQAAYATAAGFDDSGRLVGCGTVIVRPGHWQGSGPTDPARLIKTGYLCDLRVAPGFRGGLNLARAYGGFMDWIRHEHGAELVTTVIFDANKAARAALTTRSDKRADQPVYRPMTPFEMVSIQFTTSRAAPKRVAPLADPTDPAHPSDLAELREFLAARARERPLGEVLDATRFADRLATWPGFSVADFLVARNARGAIVGCLAPWDTGSLKRTRVLGYHGAMVWQKRLYNAAAHLRRFTPLPPPGACFRFPFLTHLEVADDDPAVLHDLLLAAYARLRPRGYHFMSAFLARGSPLAPAFKGFTQTRTAMTLYAVHPPDSPWADIELRTQRPGFEMALS